MTQQIKDLFAGDIYRRIEEVIKVDQTDEQVIREEIGEYIVTNTIRDHFREILDQYSETPNRIIVIRHYRINFTYLYISK